LRKKLFLSKNNKVKFTLDFQLLHPKTGTQGIKGDYLRSIIPHELCIEILKSCIDDKKENNFPLFSGIL